jgi:ATP-binding cassette, subfamily B (MDR/TAP), member 1
MGLEGSLRLRFDSSADHALKIGLKGAFIEGCTFGVTNAIIYLAEAVLFYVGAVLMANGTYTYLQMVEVLNLVVFNVSISAQLLSFSESFVITLDSCSRASPASKVAKSTQATSEIMRLAKLEDQNEESKGVLMPIIQGSIVFKDVNFSYPERPNVPILKNLNLEIFEGERVAIVGTSGSGKTTLASLLQRLYEPENGIIYFGLNHITSINLQYLRHNLSVVSQQPHLLDATVLENIAYGNGIRSATVQENARAAAKAALADEFISSLPKGYDTTLGDNASQLSGGQAQRLQIARALARPQTRVLILDECTSALDPSTESEVLDSIFSFSSTSRPPRTTVVITHKMSIMRRCDRIVVMDKGRVCEQGTFEQLMDQKGKFCSLVHCGEWIIN